MKIVETGKFRILTPEDGKWLFHYGAKTFSQEVYLGVGDDGSAWQEITEEEKIRLEAEWKNEVETTEEEYATAGKILLGVSE